uniref:Small ribosomal subunit protein uS3c n=1 Tax=Phacotus lenticularis TaxID=52965 RepID=A0A0S2LQF7_9CHLO|nr:ribosomal protein S3 [Phacotus lenticularis]ALO63620.1 ribosomal protein S3 [Phacotus lenticularis]
MGQKVHPLGFRVGITKKHQSQWFARFNKYKYAQSVLEDRMLRQTLTNLFPDLLNPLLKKVTKKDEDTAVTPKITQIKIERGLIPYEIGIGIYAENCELLKSAIDNLKVNRDLVCKLQKARRYLLNLRTKLNYVKETDSLNNQNNENIGSEKGSKEAEKQRRNTKFKPRLTKREQRRQRLIKKRLKKRQSIRRRYRQLASKGLFLKKTGNKVVQKVSLKGKKGRFNTKKGLAGRLNLIKGVGRTGLGKAKVGLLKPKKVVNKQRTNYSTFNSRIKKKFVSIYIQKMNKKFLTHLKQKLSSWSEKMNVLSMGVQQSSLLENSNFAPLGYNKKWSLNRLNLLKKQPITKLQRLIRVLEQKSLIKLESLRKEFIAFGSISTERSFAYYQIVNFLKHLKELVNKLRREQKLQLILNKVNKSSTTSLNVPSLEGTLTTGSQAALLVSSSTGSNQTSLSETVLRKKLNNIEDECRKIKFIEYLKELIKKHRTNNIYLYLSTIADARKDLRKLKQFTKRHANFLFGLNLTSLAENKEKFQEKVHDRVSQVFDRMAAKSDFDKNLQDIFNEQIEKQRTMYTENAQLTPKITLKFYSVNSKTLQSKASVVADSVVDALEKRKAFRKVIKDAKENLMRTGGVKGVKIQVAGRLNGAEIARTEWVRAGRVPLQTLRANLDYSYKTANTIYGIIGVKVWIFKGYTKFIN